MKPLSIPSRRSRLERLRPASGPVAGSARSSASKSHFAVGALSALFCLAVAGRAAHATTYNPTNATELYDVINQANGNYVNDVIELNPANSYILTDSLFNRQGWSGTGLASVGNDFGGTLTINGHGATITRDAAALSSFRLLMVDNGAVLTLNDLTLTNGKATSGPYGGAIYNNGNLTLNRCVLSGNHAQGRDGEAGTDSSSPADGQQAQGGSLYSYSGVVTITDSTFTNNSAIGGAGGDGPSSYYGGRGGGAQGGALYLYSGSLVATGSTFGNNDAIAGSNGASPHVLPAAISDGGGLYLGTTATLVNCTVANNKGGIYSSGGLTLINSTVAGNSRYGAFNSGSLNLRNSLIVGNGDGSNNVNPNSPFVGGADNITTGSASAAGLETTDSSDAVVLKNNGGPTPTIALLGASGTAINTGNNSLAKDASNNSLSFDQRGSGFARIKSGTVDIGAYEANEVFGAANVTFSGAQNSAFSGQLTASKNDPTDTLTYAVDGTLPDGLSLDTATGLITGTPSAISNGVSVGFTVTDNHGATASATATFNIKEAVSLVVTSTADAVDDLDGVTTLREAILLANSDAGLSAITFDTAAFGTAQTIVISGALPNLSANVTITGSTGGVTLDGVSKSFNLVTVNNGVTATFNAISFTNGAAGLNNSGTSIVNGCTLASNAQVGVQSSGNLTMVNSTLTGSFNGAQVQGTTAFTNCTISGNSNIGISNYGIATLKNCLSVGNRVGVSGTGPIISGVDSLLSGTPAEAGLEVDGDGNAILKNNGGPTPTFALLGTTGTAINAGNNSYAKDANGNTLAFDQRGSGHSRIKTGTVDIGAFEVAGPLKAVNVTLNGNINSLFNGQLPAYAADDADTLTYTLDGPLPDGLSFDDSTGLITGTPTAMSNGVTVGFTVTDNHGATSSAIATFNIREAASLVVTSIADPGDNYDGVTTLREAITFANSNSDSSAITFDPAAFGTPQTIVIGSQLPSLTANVTITGSAAGVTVNGTKLVAGAPVKSTVFGTNSGTNPGITATFRNLTIANGNNGIFGGVRDTIIVIGCTLTGNQIGVGSNGPVKVSNSTIIGNANNGLLTFDTLALTNCTVTGNSSGTYGYGPITLKNSIVLGNRFNFNGPSQPVTNPDSVTTGTPTAAGLEVDGDGNAVLKDNGGPTPTVALVSAIGSAVNKGVNALATDADGVALGTDQRGSGHNRIIGGTVDMGAYESSFIPPTRPVLDDATFTFPYGQAISGVKLAGTDANGDTLSYGTNDTLPDGINLKGDGSFIGTPTALTPTAGVAITVRVSDGNTPSVTANITLKVVDAAAPTATITTPTPNQKMVTTAFDSTSVKGTASDNLGVTAVDVKLYRNRNGVNEIWDGISFSATPTTRTLPASFTPGTSVNWTFDNTFPSQGLLLPAVYQVWVFVRDAAGNTTTAHNTFTLINADGEKPVVAVATPTSNQKILISAFAAGTIHGTTSDNVGVASVKVRLYRKRPTGTEFWNGTAFQPTSAYAAATLNGAGTGWSLDNVPSEGQLDSGVYTVAAYATDAAGNTGASVARSFILGTDFIAPSVSISTPLANSRIKAPNFGSNTITGRAADNIGVTSVRVRLVRKRGLRVEYWNGRAFTATSTLVDASILAVATDSATATFSAEVPWVLDQAPAASDLDNGVYTITAYAYDAVGNAKASTGRSFTIYGAATITSAAEMSINSASEAPAPSAGGS